MKNKLVFYGNETLKKVAEKIENIDGELIELIDDMHLIMHKENGIGLAAPQIDISKRLFIFDFKDYYGGIKALINPVIKEFSEEVNPYDEGCLSLPNIFEEIVRPSTILVSGITPDGKEIEIEADGLLARVIQHEVDHLNGILFIDHLERFVKNELRSDLKKIKKLNKK